jgi:gluconate 5-dehydrogenase
MNLIESFNLKNKVAIVTGGYGHIGTAITHGLCEAGATVIVAGRSNDKFEKVFSSNNNNILFQDMDLSKTESIIECFQTVFNKFGKIDILINNAFYLEGQDPEKMTDKDWNFGIDGTLNSVYRCIREIIPYMKEKNKGKIINISSMYGMVSPDFEIYKETPQFLNPPHYGAAKAGVIQLAKYYAVYLGTCNINVNTITLGPFPSSSVQENNIFIENLNKKNPLHRIGKPDDVKGACVFLSSNASDYITGHNLVIDGGWTIW